MVAPSLIEGECGTINVEGVVSAQRTITSEEICLFSLWVRLLDIGLNL